MAQKDYLEAKAKFHMDFMAMCIIFLTIVATWLFNNFNSVYSVKYMIATVAAVLLVGSVLFLRSKANKDITELAE